MIPESCLSTFTLPTLPNHASRDITERKPWEGADSAPPKNWTKAKVRAFDADTGTRHLYYSVYEGDNRTLRMSKENAPRLMRALAVDYDCYTIDELTLQNVLDTCPSDYCPAFVSRSHSGGVHALWLFEEPIWVMSPDLRKRLLAWFKKHLKLTSFLPGMDEKFYGDGMLYLSCGTEWQQLDSNLITTATTARALQECAVKASFRGSGVAVPLDVVAAEVEARFPGRWHGEFAENARGTRFWDDSGDAQSCIVKPEGMLCYTGDKGFMDWASIFGSGFVSKFEDDKIGGALTDRWFDGKDFWEFSDATKAWRVISREDLARRLKVEGLSAAIDKSHTYSEVDKTLDTIARQNHVMSAAPYVQRRPGVLHLANQRHLNTSNVEACQPIEGDVTDADFPWIANFLDNTFSPVNYGQDQTLLDFMEDGKEQMWRFLAWLKRAYEAGLNFKPCQGQVLILAGETGCGKTLLADVLIATALGGKADASRYVLGETHFNKKMFHVPCWTINDASAVTEPQRKARYNSLVKQVAANRDFSHEAKGKDAVDVAWMGRLVITCNVDPESIQMMPSMDSSMEDKILALRVWGGNEGDTKESVESAKGFGLVGGRTPDENISHELPAFLRWLLNWEPPAWVKREPRFGFVAWAHPALKEEADSVSYGSTFEEMLRRFLGGYFSGEALKDKTEWEGSATMLLECMQADGSLVKNVARTYNAHSVGKNLSALVNKSKCYKRMFKGCAKYIFTREMWQNH